MKEQKLRLEIFPKRIREALEKFRRWDEASEIRLRRNKPLAITTCRGNVILNEKGQVSSPDEGLRVSSEELTETVAAFCSGNLYRYFDTLRDGFLMDEEGFRLGVCPAKDSFTTHLPESFEGLNLRIPRSVPEAASPFFDFFRERPLASSLVLSPPGVGKTTLLRAVAARLSTNFQGRPFRVAVIDERKELFPSRSHTDGGTCDVLSGYDKEKGLEIACRIFSPEIIVCDEIASMKEAEAVITSAGTGCMIFASAHGGSFEEASRRPFVRRLLEERVFHHLFLLRRRTANGFETELLHREVK